MYDKNDNLLHDFIVLVSSYISIQLLLLHHLCNIGFEPPVTFSFNKFPTITNPTSLVNCMLPSRSIILGLPPRELLSLRNRPLSKMGPSPMSAHFPGTMCAVSFALALASVVSQQR